jgi:hypothetical protein
MPINPTTGLTYSEDITESSSNYVYKTAPVTAVSGNGTTITYTAANTFNVGDVIDVTGSDISGYNVTDATVATASATQFTVTNATTGTNTSTNVIAFTASSVTPNIDAVVDLSYTAAGTNFDLTNVAYDVSFDNLPFILKVDNQNPYRRETAQYKKDQFDNSVEPGEQSLTGWWVRSQTSWHNGAGIEFYEPGSDYEHVSHRFYDSRGVDVWTVGELRLHKNVFHAYTSSASKWNAAAGRNGSGDVLVVGDEDGWLKRVTLNDNSAATVDDFKNGATYPEGHNGTVYPFLSVTTDGSNYYAACQRAIHTGQIDTLTSDEVAINFSTSNRTDLFIKYAKGFILFALGSTAYNLNIVPKAYTVGGTSITRTTSSHNHTGGTDSLGSNLKTHVNPSWIWNDATASPGPVYMSGNGGNNGEVWKILFDESTNAIDMPGATMVLSLPNGELVNAIHFYLGYLAVGTTKGIRICPVDSNGNLIMGPLLIETSYPVNGFTERGSYLYAATKVVQNGNTNGILIRIDLSQQFDDGTFAYAYDLEYQSALDGDNSDCTEVYNLVDSSGNDRLVMVIEEDGVGELQVEHTTDYRTSGWLQTGRIRYSTVEPKFFKYLQTRGLASTGDSIAVQTIDYAGNEYDIITLDAISLGQNVGLSQPVGGQEFISIKYTLNNGSPITDYPILQSYQLKSIPGVPRQRLYQYPLSCFDIEMDKYNAQFGYKGRAYNLIQTLEQLEISGDFVTVKDYRTEESYQGVIEEVRFTNESSPDKDSNGFGGLLLVTVRKL